MERPIDLPFSEVAPRVLHVDFNSCFASIEQQANPLLRGKPLVVVPYANSNSGCVLTASREARKFGIKTGMNLREARRLCPFLLARQSDPDKYRFAHRGLKRILSDYGDNLKPKSIDEFVLDLNDSGESNLWGLGLEIKERIKKELGEWLTVSVGIGQNAFLAKTAAGIMKPDGLVMISKDNYEQIYKSLELVDLCGINYRYERRLKLVEIRNVWQMFLASPQKLNEAFKSVASLYWYMRLRGYEVDGVDFKRRSFGHTYSIPKPLARPNEWLPVLAKLSEKAAYRLRKGKYLARAATVMLSYRDGDYWGQTMRLSKIRGEFSLMGPILKKCLLKAPTKPVRNLAITYHDLDRETSVQESLFEGWKKSGRVIEAVDKLKERSGEWVISPAVLTAAKDVAPDAIAFGNVKDL